MVNVASPCGETVDATAYQTEVQCRACGFDSRQGHHTISIGETYEMSSNKMQIKRLEEECAKLVAEIDAKTHELRGLQRALAVLKESEEEEQGANRRRMAIKDPVLRLLEEFKDGLTAAEVVEIGRSRGQALDRASVSSLLSRLKRDGALTLDGTTSKYRIVPSAKEDSAAAPKTAAAQPTSVSSSPAATHQVRSASDVVTSAIIAQAFLNPPKRPLTANEALRVLAERAAAKRLAESKN